MNRTQKCHERLTRPCPAPARAPRATAFAGFGHGENVIRTGNKGMYLADYGT